MRKIAIGLAVRRVDFNIAKAVSPQSRHRGELAHTMQRRIEDLEIARSA